VSVRSLVSIFLTPPAINMLLIAAGLILIARSRRIGMLLCTTGLISMWLLSTPVVSSTLARLLEAYPALDINTLPTDATMAIVVAGASHYDQAAEYGVSTPNDDALIRLHYVANLHNRTGLPILTTGGPMNRAQDIHAEVLAESLLSQFGIATQWLEKKSSTTGQNAEFSAEILLPEGVDTILLVTQAYHMRRAVKLYQMAGFTVHAAPTQLSAAFPWQQWKYWLPKVSSLELSYLVSHETLGLLWNQLTSAVERAHNDQLQSEGH